MNTPSLPRCLVAQLSVRLFAGLLGDRAAALGLNSRVRGLSHSRAGFENKRRVAAETWDRCGELSLPVIDRTAASHQALRASAKTSHRLKERGRPAHRSCFDVGGTPTLLEFSSRFRFFSRARAASLALALLASPALLVNQASAATSTWDGTTDRVWTTATNWDDDVVPVSASSTDIIIRGTTNTGGMILGTARTIKSLTFNSTNTNDSSLWLLTSTNLNSGARNLTFSSNSGNATLTVESGSNGSKTIERPSVSAPTQIILTSSLDVIHNGSGILKLGNSSSSVNATYISGAGGINKSGTGTLLLAGNNTYTGTTTINAGTLNLTGTLNGTLTTASGGTFVAGAGARAANATFTAGTANATNALTVTNRLVLAGGINATLTGGTSFTAQGADLANSSSARTITLSGGTLALNNALGISITNPSFETDAGVANYFQSRAITGWTATTGTYIEQGGSRIFAPAAPLAYDGSTNYKWAVLQGAGNFSQTITVGVAGNYTISFEAAARGGAFGPLDLQAQLDGVNVTAQLIPSQSTWTSYTSNSIYLSAGSHTLNFMGINRAGGDKSSVLDNVSMASFSTLSDANLTISATSSSVLDLGFSGGAHSIGALNLTAGGSTTALTLANGTTLTLAGDASNNAISATGTSGQTASIIPGTSAPSLIIAAGKNISVDSGVTLTVQSVISGNSAVNKIGAGTLALTGNNTYTGATTITAGTLEFGASANQTLSGVISGSGALTKSNIGTMILSGNNTYAGTTTINGGTLQIGAGGTSGSLSTSSSIVNNGTLTINRSDTVTQGTDFANSITGSGSLIKSGANTLVLGTNTYTGTTTVGGGTLQLSGNISSSALTLNSGGVISVGTNSSLTTVNKVNASSLTLSGGSGYAFTIGNISGGTVGTAGTDYDQLTTTGAITFNNTVANPFTVYLNGTPTNWSSSGSYTWNILSGASLSGFSSGNFIADTSAFGASLASGASFTFGTSGGNLTLTYGSAGTPVWAGGTGVWSGNFTPSLSNNLGMVFTGAGGTATNDIGNATLSAVGAITFNSTAGAYTLAANSGSAGNGTALAVNGDITNNSANLQTINTAISFGADRTINTAAGNITIGGAISGSGSLTKNGTGTLTLSGSRTNTGNLTINAGNVNVNAAAAFVNTTVNAGGRLTQTENIWSNVPNITLNGGAFVSNSFGEIGAITMNNGTITQSGGYLRAWGGWTLSGNNTINVSSYINIDGSGIYSGVFNVLSGTTTISGVVGQGGNGVNAIGFTKNGTGTLVLTGANSWGGGTGNAKLNAGTLVLNNNTALGNNTFTINGGTLDVTTGTSITLTNNNTQSWNGDFTFLGTNGSLNIGTGNVTMNASRTVTVNAGNFTVGGIIAGSGFGLTKNGSGTMILAGANTYTGTTTINAGTLQIGNGTTGSINNTSAIVNNGDLIFNKNEDFTIKSVTGSGNLTATTSNRFITLGGNITQNGSVRIASSNAIGQQGIVQSGNTTITASSINMTGSFANSPSNLLTLDTSAANGNIYLDVFNGAGGHVSGGVSAIVANAGTGNVTIGGSQMSTNWLGRWAGSLTGAINVSSTFYAGNYLNLTATANSTSSGSLILSANTTNTWTVNPNVTMTYAGVISSEGNGSITKNGTGTLLLTNANTYNGTTVINAGTVQIGAGGTTGALSSGSAITNNGTLVFNRSNTITQGTDFANSITGTGNLIQAGSGTLVLGTNTYNGATTVNAGTLQLGGNITSSALTLNSGATISVGTTTAAAKSTASTITIGGNTNYLWTLSSGALGSTPGTDYDQLSATGALTFNNTELNPFTVFVYGNATGWDGSLNKSWNIMSAGSVVGFSSANFSVNLSNFTSVAPANRTGIWSFSSTGGNITLNYELATPDYFWGGASGNWSDTYVANTTGFTPGIPQNNKNIFFSGANGTSATVTNNVASGTLSSLNFITFNSTAGAYTLNASAGAAGASGGTALTMLGDIVNNSASTQTINMNLAYTGMSSGIVNTAVGNVTIGGAISGTGALIKQGNGTLTLNGNNTYTGATTISGGTLAIGSNSTLSGGNYSQAIANSGTFILGSNSNHTLSGLISGNGALTKNGTGTLTLTASNTYTGATMVNAGTLNLTGNLSDTAITVAGSSVFTQGASSIISGTSSFTHNSSGVSTLAGANTYTGATTISAGTLQITSTGLLGSGTYSQNIANNGAFIFGSNSNQTFSGVISGTGALTKNGTGTLTLSNTNTYTGNTTINSGTVVLNSTGNSNTAVIRGNVTVNSGATLVTTSDYTGFGWSTGPTSLNINGGMVNVGNGVNYGHVWNTLTGGINFTGGTLQSNNGTSTQSGFQLEWAAPVVNTHASADTATIAGRINIRSETTPNVIFTVADGAAATDLLVSAAITGGAVGFTKNGTGTMALTGNNTYTGATIINAGTLEIGAAGRLNAGSYAGAITNNGTLIYSGTNAQTLSGAITGTGALTHNASSTLTLSGANNYNGTTTINAGTLAIGNSMTIGAITGAGNLTLSSGTLTTISSSNTTLSGAISGGGALTKNGSGTLTLAGATTHSGATAVSGGTLQLTGNISSSALTLNSGGVISVGTNSTLTTINKVNASSITINGGSGFAFTIGNVGASVAGTDFDQLTATGAVTLNNTVANPFTVYLNGTPTSWSNSGSYSWNIISAASVTGFSSGNFAINLADFGIASSNRTGTWAFANSGGNITLSYAAAGPDAIWSGSSGNWSTGFSPSVGTDKNLTFTGATGTATNDIASGTLSSVNFITFNSTAGAYTLAANAGSAGASGGTALTVKGDIVNNSASTQTINTALAFGASSTGVINSASGNITVGGVISGAGGLIKQGNNSLTLSANNTYTGATTISAGTLEVSSTGLLGGGSYSAAISNAGSLLLGSNSNQTLGGVISGAGALTKNGTGTLTLGAANTYTGNTTVNSGTLQLSNAGKVGAGSLSVASGATLALNSLSQTVAGLSGAGNITWGQSASTVSDGSALISSAKNYTQKLDFGLGGGATVNGVVFNHADTSGTGWALTGAGSRWNSESGSGYAQLMSDFYYGGNPGALTFTGLTTGAYYEAVVYTQIGSWGDRPQNATFSNNGSSQFTLSNIDPGNFGAVVYRFQAQGTNASITMAPTAAGTFHWFGASLELVGSQTLTVGDSGNYDFSGVISGPIALNKVGSGTQTLSGNNTYTGGTTLNAGQLNINSATALGTGNFTIAGGTIDNTSGSAKTLTNNNTQNWNADFTFAGTNDLNMGTGNVTMNASRTVTVNAGNFTVGGIISGASMGLTKNGTGTMILTGANTYNGVTTINAGTLQIGNGATGSIDSTSSIVNNGSLVINKNESMTLKSMTGTGNLTADFATGFLRLGGNITLDGTVTINNTKGQTGGQAGIRQSQNTTIRASAITLNGSLGSAGNDSFYQLTLDTSSTNGTINLDIYNGMGGHTWAGASSVIANAGTGALNIVGSQAGKGGAWDANLTGALNIASTYTAGTLTLNATAASSISGSVTLAANSVNNWTVSPGVTMTASGVLAGSNASITKAGTGTMILSANNTYNGTTTINAGTIQMANATGLGSGGNISFTGGGLQYGSGITTDISSRIKNSTGAVLIDTNSNNVTFASAVDSTNTLGLTKNGSGTLTLNGNNTYTGTTTINTGGVLPEN